jgi:pimeloyl-ACP methyl ester carboxylesterase
MLTERLVNNTLEAPNVTIYHIFYLQETPMPMVGGNEFRIHYEITCPGHGPTLLLVPGLGEQIGSVCHPKEQCRIFADHGFQVVRMDNRDSGLSLPLGGEEHIKTYTLLDLADDVAAVIKDLDAGPVHLAGSSLGGYTVRWAAIRHPGMIKTLTVVMSGCGAIPKSGGPRLPREAMARLAGHAETRPRDKQIAWHKEVWRWLWGNGYPFPAEWVEERLGYAYDRSYRPDGNLRLLEASGATPGIWDAQQAIACPTLIMHGGEDPCFPPEHGQAMAERIPGSELWLDPGMGHMMHQEQWREMANRVAKLAGMGNR